MEAKVVIVQCKITQTQGEKDTSGVVQDDPHFSFHPSFEYLGSDPEASLQMNSQKGFQQIHQAAQN
jgi:hypothetical protein